MSEVFPATHGVGREFSMPKLIAWFVWFSLTEACESVAAPRSVGIAGWAADVGMPGLLIGVEASELLLGVVDVVAPVALSEFFVVWATSLNETVGAVCVSFGTFA